KRAKAQRVARGLIMGTPGVVVRIESFAWGLFVVSLGRAGARRSQGGDLFEAFEGHLRAAA
ncbi:MAG: hypothetical protein EA401_14315, partial [Planctomycetota bacterium]